MAKPGSKRLNHIFIGGDDDSPNVIEIGKASDTIIIPGTIQKGHPTGPSVSDTVGTVQMFAGATAPTGWLLCDGSAVSQTDYADLFSVIGVTYGNPGGGNFNLPDFRGRTPIGVGTGVGLTARALADSGGVEVTDPTGRYPGAGTDVYAGTSDSSMAAASVSTEGSASVPTISPFLALNFIIRV
jgi:microcystin-dependent protein